MYIITANSETNNHDKPLEGTTYSRTPVDLIGNRNWRTCSNKLSTTIITDLAGQREISRRPLFELEHFVESDNL